jgi:hypothetical protein
MSELAVRNIAPHCQRLPALGLHCMGNGNFHHLLGALMRGWIGSNFGPGGGIAAW